MPYRVFNRRTGEFEIRGEETPVVTDNNLPPPRNDYNYGAIDPNDTNDIGLTRLPNETDAEYRSRINNSSFGLVGGGNNYRGGGTVKTLTPEESTGLAKSYGLQGMGFDESFAGNTRDQADEKARVIKQRLLSQTSQNTSYNFSPEVLSGVKNAYNNFQLKLDEITNGMAWSSKGTKNDALKTLILGSVDSFAKPFNSIEEFNRAYQGNLDIQKGINTFIKAGGSMGDITSKIQMKNGANGNVPAGWDAETYANFKKANPTLEPDAEDTARMNGTYEQTTADYIGAINGADNSVNAENAEKALFPESELAQQEIARQLNIPRELISAYFGDEKTIGLLQQKKSIAEEEKKLVEKKIEDSTTTVREKANYEIDKNNADLEIARNTIEENRLSAKNYMTGMLAKLGALQTTGAAPLALVTLDQKYRQQKQQLDTKIKFANQGIRINMRDDINKLSSEGEDLILKIQEDLTKDSETALKEINKAKNDTDKQIYAITQKYATRLKTEKDKYEKESKTASQKYIKDYTKLASKGYDANTINGILTGKSVDPTNATGQYADINALPQEVQDPIVEAIINGLTLSQLKSRFTNVSTAVLNNIWNQMTSKNTGAAVEFPPKPTKTTTAKSSSGGSGSSLSDL